MAGRKKNSKQDSKGKKASSKKYTLIYTILLIVLGVLFVLISLFPSSMGSVGRFIDKKFLAVIFGKASLLVGLYCICIGFVLLFFKKKIKFISGLTCLLIPLFMIIDILFTSKPTDENLEAESSL